MVWDLTFNGNDVPKMIEGRVETELNALSFAKCRVLNLSSTERSTYVGGHTTSKETILSRKGTEVLGGFLEEANPDGRDVNLVMRGYEALLMDENVKSENSSRGIEYINQTGATIVKDLLDKFSTKVTWDAGDIDFTETISGTMRFQDENLLKCMAKVCNKKSKDFWVEKYSAGVYRLHVGTRGNGTYGSPYKTFYAGKEVEVTYGDSGVTRTINRITVLGKGDGMNQVRATVPYVNPTSKTDLVCAGDSDSDRSCFPTRSGCTGTSGGDPGCVHANATSSQSTYGILEGRPYIDEQIGDIQLAIDTAKAILDDMYDKQHDIGVKMIRLVADIGLGDWIKIIDVVTGLNTSMRVKKIVRTWGREERLSIEFQNPFEILDDTFNNLVRDSDTSRTYEQGATNLLEINFPDICDNTHPYEMWFEFPSEIKYLNRVKFSYIVDDYRAFSATTGGGSSHTHDIDIDPPLLSGSGGSDIGLIGVQTQGSTNKFICKANITSVKSNVAESTHTHDIDYALSTQADALTDVAIWIDDGGGYVDRTAAIEAIIGTLSTTQELDIDITLYLSATAGIKKVKVVPTDASAGECRITGLCMVQFYMESK